MNPDIPRLLDGSPLSWPVVKAVKEAYLQPHNIKALAERFSMTPGMVRQLAAGRFDWLRLYQQGRD